MSEKTCRCELCETTRRVRNIAERVGGEDGDFVREIWLRAMNAEMDLDYIRCKEREEAEARETWSRQNGGEK